MIIELTEKLIQDAFSKTGIDKKYYPQYEAEVKRCYAALQKDTPDDEESTENDNNVKASLDNTNEYIVFYVSEIEKGHSHAWSNAYAHYSVLGENDFWIVQYTLESLEVNERDKEFEIHANSIVKDPIFVNRFKDLFGQGIADSCEKAKEYCQAYHKCIGNGKSEIYAHAYAEAVNEGMIEIYCDIYAEAYELAITHGEDDSASDDFGRFCSNAADNSILMLQDFSKKFTKDWQKEFFVQLICKDYEKDYKRPMDNSLLEEIRKELYK